MEISTATPAEIDSALFPLWHQRFQVAMSLSSDRDRLREQELRGKGAWRWAEQIREQITRKQAEIERLNAEAAPLQSEYLRRGGWSRFYLVTERHGHYHRDEPQCPTVYPSTATAWIAEMSGSDAAQMIERAGHHACTVCFPGAPLTAAWARSEAAAAKISASEKLAKQVAGYDRRARKVASTRKTLERSRARATAGEQYVDTEWDERSVRYAEDELSRWAAKYPDSVPAAVEAGVAS